MIARPSKQPLLNTADPSSGVDVVGLLQRRANWVLAGAMIGAVLALLYAYTANRVYQSESEVLVINKDARIANTSVDAQFGEEVLATHQRMMSSRRIVADAIQASNLLALPGLNRAIESDSEDPVEPAVTYIIENLEVKQGGEGRSKGALVLRPTFRHSDSHEAKLILSSVVNSYKAFVNENVYGADDEAANLIAEASQRIEQQVIELETSYRKFRESAPILWKRDGSSVNPHEIRLLDIESSLSKLRLRKAQVASRLEVVQTHIDNDQIVADLQQLSVIDNEDIGRLTLLLQAETGQPISEQFQAAQPVRVETASAEFDRLLALELSSAKQKNRFGKNHPNVVELDRQIVLLREFLDSRGELPTPESSEQGVTIDRLAKTYTRLLKNDMSEFQRQEAALLALADQERNRAKELVRLELEEESLRNASDRARALHNSVIDRLNEINLLKDHGGFISKVINPVRIGQLAWPNIPLILGLGIVLGSLVGTGGAFWAELNDNSFFGPDDVFDSLRLPILGQIPNFAPARRAAINGFDRCIPVVHHPESEEAEAFHLLRAALYSSVPEHQVLHIASPGMGSGNSTVASNLSVAIANTGHSVLLIDGNLRQPTLHQHFALANETGLSTLLAGESGTDSSIQSSLIPNLDVMTCGPGMPKPAELVAGTKLAEVLTSVRDRYDYVLIDGPPILTFSDSLAIASQADFVLLNISPATDSRDTAMASVQKLASLARKPIVGTIVNRSGWSAADAFYGPSISTQVTHNAILSRLHGRLAANNELEPIQNGATK